MPSLEIRQLRPHELRTALRLTMAVPGLDPSAVESHVGGFLDYARALSLDVSPQWIALDAGRIVDAATLLPCAGRTALLFLPPTPCIPVLRAARSALIQRALTESSGRDIRLVQCLTLPEDNDLDRLLAELGFTRIALLTYMERLASDSDSALNRMPQFRHSTIDDIRWSSFDQASNKSWIDLLEASYVDSLDCPRLTGLRAMSDVIAGHMGAGIFRPELWLMASIADTPAACIILAENPVRPVLELVYMGIKPDFRRRGLGRALLSRAMAAVQASSLQGITLAVDHANTPALRLYEEFQFRRTAQRRAWINLINPTARQ